MHGNIIHDMWMQISDDLGFSRYAASLDIVVVIFEEKVLRENGI